jgi:hypothetical protein
MLQISVADLVAVVGGAGNAYANTGSTDGCAWVKDAIAKREVLPDTPKWKKLKAELPSLRREHADGDCAKK